MDIVGWLLVVGYIIMWLFTAVVVAGLVHADSYDKGLGDKFLSSMLGLLAGAMWPLVLITIIIMKLAFKKVR